MNSLNNEFEISENEAKAVIEYIDEHIDAYMEEAYNIVCVELYNGEKILCMYDFDDPTTLYMPIHLIENITNDDYAYKISYLLYPYHNLASDCSELMLDEIPKVVFAPKSVLMMRYMTYWNDTKAVYESVLEQAPELEQFDIYPETNIIS